MLSDLRCQATAPLHPLGLAPIACDDRYSRSMEEDLKEAISLLFKFKAGLDKLHPQCTALIEKMMSFPPRY